MIKLFLDIETLPAEEKMREEIAKEITSPKNLKTEDAIKEWEENEKPLKIEETFRKTALSGDFGRILCVGYIKEMGQKIDKEVIKGEEVDILKKFWDVARDVDLFIGHNILGFDLKFIVKRSIVHRIKPTLPISFARFRSEPIYDTMCEWEKWSGFISLDKLAKALGFESSKGTLDGSKVYDYHQEGRTDEIYDYCMADVELTRKIYYRMNFSEPR